MLYTFLLTVLVLDCIVLMLAILLQSGKGSGLAASFGGASSSPDALIGIRQAGNLLTTISWWGGGLFLGLCFVLQIMSTHTSAPRSVLEKGLGSQPANVAPPPTSAPAVPLEPAPTANTPTTTTQTTTGAKASQGTKPPANAPKR
ncbi:MAG TPA: preprotein translocase subunit SecG [Gemmatimonadaceae bacterium]|jgi:preprotein translocase subunit SecG|nr:preprotein translocase subunit SecG [Gemmatimonadaceae bacterium]